MGNAKLKVKIIAESGILLEEEFEYVLIPGEAGDIGVLPQHVNLISTLRTGVVELRSDSSSREILVDGGFVNIHNNEVTILANEAADKDELVEAEIKQAEEDAKQKLAQDLPPEDLLRAEKQLRFAQLRRKSLK